MMKKVLIVTTLAFIAIQLALAAPAPVDEKKEEHVAQDKAASPSPIVEDSSHGNMKLEESSHGYVKLEDSSHGVVNVEDSSHGAAKVEDTSHGLLKDVPAVAASNVAPEKAQ